MAFERSFDDGPDGLVSLMNGCDTLNGWDVLMSYSLVQLNALLAERATCLKLNTTITWEAESTDPLGLVPDHTLVFNVQILQPTLRFVDTSNAVKLTFGLAGSFYAKDMPEVQPKQLPSGLTCELATSLVNVAGQWHDEGWQPATGTTEAEGPVGNNWVTVLEPGASPGSEANINTKTLVTLKPLVATYIEEHFSSHGLHLCLAAVANSYDVNDKTSEVLQPTQFCFTVAGDVVMIWIGLKGGPNTGTRASGQTGLIFALNSKAVSPIPLESTASIIFSHNTMVNMFLKPALAASPSVDNIKEVVSTSVKTNIGLVFKFTLVSNAIVIDEEKGSASNMFGGEASYHVDGCTANMNEKLVTLNVHCRDEKDEETKLIAWPLSLKWSTDAKRITNSSSYTSPEGNTSDEYAVAHVTFHYGGHGAWTASSDPFDHPNLLGVVWSLDSELSLTIAPEKPTLWQSIAGHKTSDIPAKYVNLRPAAPALDLTLKPLDYFLTTNLLLPGQHVFHADPPLLQSKMSGLAIPRDVILTGSVAPNSKSASVAHQAVQIYHLSVASMSNISETIFSHIEAPQKASMPTMADFKNALLGFPANNLMGDFVQLIDKVDANADEPFKPMAGLLDNLDKLFGDGEPASNATTSTDSVTSVDLRLYAGYYIVNQPVDDQGEQFHVHPHTGAIRMRGKDVVPLQSYDVENKRVGVTWQLTMGRVINTYSVSFSVVADKQTLPLKPTARITNVALILYRGSLMTKLDFINTNNNSTITENNNSAADASSYTTTIYNIVQVASIAVGLGPYFWKVTDYKKKIKTQIHIISQLQFEQNGLHDFTVGALEPLARTEYAKHGGLVDAALARPEERVNEAAREYLESKTKQREVRNYIADSVHQTLKEEAPRELNGVIKKVFKDVVNKNTSRNTLNPDRYKLLLESFQKADCNRTVERLQSQPTPNSLHSTEMAGQQSIDAALADLARVTHQTTAKEYKQAANTVKLTEIERKGKVDAKQKAASALALKDNKANRDALDLAQRELTKTDTEMKEVTEHREKARVEERQAREHHEVRERKKHHTAEHMVEKRRHVMSR
ncbi:hypothetical protein Sste5346_009143 [Sporothrix stenoceras]|uniref:Uncharacterized protein n=1 Tax=Sporothrix stenoceras TaxID=5173 RepID=A0ABR3YMJ6_9PEZI